VAVLDIRMPDLDGIAVAAAISRDEVQTKVVMLSAYLDGGIVYKALAAGARAFLSKDSDRREVCEAIVAVAWGEVVIPPGVHSGLVEQIHARGSREAGRLSDREREVLALIAAGSSRLKSGDICT
jgi:two-component system nitrate/nitrite response regulator NarL